MTTFQHKGDERRARRLAYKGISFLRKWAKNPINDDPASTHRAIAEVRRALRRPLLG